MIFRYRISDLVLVAIVAFCPLGPALAGVSATTVRQADSAVVIPMTHPFLFAYGTWDKRVRVEGGEAALDGDGTTPKGGGDANLTPPLDLDAHATDSPGLRFRPQRQQGRW